MKGLCPKLAWPPQVGSYLHCLHDCLCVHVMDLIWYMWERTVMGISVHTAETETATTPYYKNQLHVTM